MLMAGGSVCYVQPRAQSALRNSPLYELRGLRVEQRGATLLIFGVVSSFYHKQLAQEAVRSVCKDAEVEVELLNRIEVRSASEREAHTHQRATV